MIDRLTEHNFGDDHSGKFHVSKWIEQWKAGYNLWRLKIWEEPTGSLKYRIVYAFDTTTRNYYILAVVHRNFNYENDHATTQRVLDTYKSLGIKVYDCH